MSQHRETLCQPGSETRRYNDFQCPDASAAVPTPGVVVATPGVMAVTFVLDGKPIFDDFFAMPSPTGVTRLVRKKKKTKQGKRRKKANAKRGTINFFKAFAVPPAEVTKKSA
jgi:hypothetical protein